MEEAGEIAALLPKQKSARRKNIHKADEQKLSWLVGAVGGVALVLVSLVIWNRVAWWMYAPKDGKDVPVQVHLTQGSKNGDAMVVSWITQSVTCGEVVLTLPNSTSITIPPDQPPFRYQYQYVLQPGSYTSGLIHHVLVPALPPHTQFRYKCGCDEGGYSEQFSFTTVGPSTTTTTKTASANPTPMTLVLFGDLGQTTDSQENVQHVVDNWVVGQGNDPRLVCTLIVGDLSYADSEGDPLLRNCTQKRWDSWGQMVQPLSANMQMMVLPGNHEVEYNFVSTQQPFHAFDSRFRLPYDTDNAPTIAANAVNNSTRDRFYSFNVQWAHVVMLNSYDGPNFNGSYDSNSRQYQWLENDLKNVDRSITPWLIAGMHAPWYNTNFAHHNEVEEVNMRSGMEGLFEKYGVDVVFAGHVHAYERTYPVFNNKTQPGAPTYINIGDGGNREGHAVGYFPQPEWSAFRDDVSYGHGTLTMFNDTHAQWSWHRVEDMERAVADQIWLVRNANGVGVHATEGDGVTEPPKYDGRKPYHVEGRVRAGGVWVPGHEH